MIPQAPVILVTGASRGLGRGIALELARSGYSVAINYAGNADAAAETQEECESAQTYENQRFLTVQADVGSRKDRERMVDHVITHFGRLDALVNNAGITSVGRKDLTESTEESFDLVMSTNLKGPFFLTQRVANYWLGEKPEPLLAGGFKIVFVTSISAHTASVNRGDYCMSKAGLSMASQLWSVRLAGEGIQVYELRPGIMLSDMTKGVKEKYDPQIANGLVPQARWGKGSDLGLAVCSLLDGDFAFSTGAIIDVDGGFQLRRL
jgi:NAD(P)-dependent dehydrogenase (short-subunit alcohol dehydrogenase family)